MMYGWPVISLISLLDVSYFKCNSLLSVEPDVTFAQVIMVLWTITNGENVAILEESCMASADTVLAVLLR